EPADIFVHAVLHDDGFGFGRALELDLVDAVLPTCNRGRAHHREQYAEACGDDRRTIEPGQRRRAPPPDHALPILIILIAIAHLSLPSLWRDGSNFWLSRQDDDRTWGSVKKCTISLRRRARLRGLVNFSPATRRIVETICTDSPQ